MKGPTERQREYLLFIADFTTEHGYAPTHREVASGMGTTSTNGVKDQLLSLKKKGLVTWAPRKSRTLRLT